MLEKGQMRWLLVLLWSSLAGCASTQTVLMTGMSHREYTDDGLMIIYTDLDGDQVPDVLKIFEVIDRPDRDAPEHRLLRTEIDLNGSGQINLWRHYDERGELTLEEMDTNLDGRIDHKVYWEGGTIVRSERDSSGDGSFDVFRFYRDGFLSRVQRDTSGNGRIDYWSYYDRHGLSRVGYDTNGDGSADTWIRREERTVR